MAQRLWRGKHHEVDVVRAEAYITLDAQRKEAHQATMANSRNFLGHLSETPEPRRLGRRLVEQQRSPERKEGRMRATDIRRMSHAPLTDAQIMEKLFPTATGMSTRPAVEHAAKAMARDNDASFVHAHLSCEPPRHLGKKMHSPILDEVRQKALTGKRRDLSLAVSGVKKVEPYGELRSEVMVPGFHAMGERSPDPRRTGKALVDPGEPYDPLRIFRDYGRRHPPPVPANRSL